MLFHFCLFFSCVLDVINSPVATPTNGLLGLSQGRRPGTQERDCITGSLPPLPFERGATGA